MKTTKTTTAQQAAIHGLTLFELDRLCDDPVRDVTGQEVQAILTPAAGGFTLSARDGDMVYPIIRDDGQPVAFRSIDAALDRLVDVPFLLQVQIDVTKWGALH